jgi:4-amino-4-deoxy-L-arabinose transferase-like glycosyltransferase
MMNWLRHTNAELPALLGTAFLALVLAGDLARVLTGWTDSQGWEYEWIARAWAGGHGYSFPGDARWLFDPGNPDDRTDPGAYYATAWEEPVPVVLLGTFFRLFGDHGRLAMTLTNALFFAATLAVVYHLGRRIRGPWLGFVSAALLAMIPTAHSLIKVYLGGSVLGGLVVSICALLLLWFQDRASVRRGLLLGAALGVAALSHAATIVFIPVAALVALLSQRPLTWRTWPCAGAIVGTALLVIAPWAARNYATFDEFVPVRNGAGFVTYLGNRAIAEIFEPSLVSDRSPFKPPRASGNLLQAVRWADQTQNMIDIQDYAENTVRATAPEGYANSNEAQRDKVFMADALGFMLRHPVKTLQLAAGKAVKFLFPTEFSWLQLIPVGCVSVLALIGLATGLKDRRVMALGLMASAYGAVYVVTFPFFYRYRYPIEPVLAVLGGIAVIWLVQLGWQLRERLSRAPQADTPQDRAGPGG